MLLRPLRKLQEKPQGKRMEMRVVKEKVKRLIRMKRKMEYSARTVKLRRMLAMLMAKVK